MTTIALLCGVGVSDDVLRRHCLAALCAGAQLVLVPMRPLSERMEVVIAILQALYGEKRLRLVEDPAGWRGLPAARFLLMLDADGLRVGGCRVLDAGRAGELSTGELEALYTTLWGGGRIGSSRLSARG